jgi:hypothetical protein
MAMACSAVVIAWRIHHHNAARRGCRNINIVHTNASATNDFEFGRGGQNVSVNFGGRANGKAVILANTGNQLILGHAGLVVDIDIAVLENVDGGLGDFVRDEDFRGGHGGVP